MPWKESLGAMRERLLHHVRSVADTQFKEGALHERVRLFNAARFSWWQRAKRHMQAMVLHEASEHEVTAREFSQAAAYRTRCEVCELTAAYEQALDALQRIVQDEPDPMEIAAVALDQAEARLARFVTGRDVVARGVTMDKLDVKLNVDTSKFRAELAEMEEKLRAISELTGAPAKVVGEPPLELRDAVPFEEVQERNVHGYAAPNDIPKNTNVVYPTDETQNSFTFRDPTIEPVGDLVDLTRQAAPDDN